MGTSPELRVHPLREILAPRPGMLRACHTARAASDETDATTRDGGAMDAARLPDPTRDVPRDDRAHDRDDTRARALLERRRRRRYEALRRVGVCSSTPIAAPPRTSRGPRRHIDTRDDPRIDEHDESFAPVERPSAALVPTTPSGAAGSAPRTRTMTARDEPPRAAGHVTVSHRLSGRQAPQTPIHRRRATSRADARRRRTRWRATAAVLLRSNRRRREIGNLAGGTHRTRCHLASCAIRVASRRNDRKTKGVTMTRGAMTRGASARRRRTREGRRDRDAGEGRRDRDRPGRTPRLPSRRGVLGPRRPPRSRTRWTVRRVSNRTPTRGCQIGHRLAYTPLQTPSLARRFAAAADADHALAAARARVRAPEPVRTLTLESFPRASPSRVASARLERAWRALKTPFAARVDAAIKFSRRRGARGSRRRWTRGCAPPRRWWRANDRWFDWRRSSRGRARARTKRRTRMKSKPSPTPSPRRAPSPELPRAAARSTRPCASEARRTSRSTSRAVPSHGRAVLRRPEVVYERAYERVYERVLYQVFSHLISNCSTAAATVPATRPVATWRRPWREELRRDAR